MSEAAAGGPLLLIDLPGLDWALLHPLIDAGELPNLARLVEAGCSGTLTAPRPQVSALLWNSLASGQPAARHGVFARVRQNPGDAAPHVLTARDRQVSMLWQRVAACGRRAGVVGGAVTHGEITKGVDVVSEYLGSPTAPKTDALVDGCISPAELREPLAECWMRPEEVDWEMLAFFEPGLGSVNQERDPRLAIIGAALAQTFSRHAALLWLLEHRRPDFTMASYALLDDLLHAFMPSHVLGRQHNAGLFGAVLDRACRLLDLLLGRLLEVAGASATVFVTSTHGARKPTGPAIARWVREPREAHRHGHGVLIAAGPAIRADALLHGARVLDVAPTVLQLLSLPVTDDLPGRVLGEILAATPATERAPAASIAAPAAYAAVEAPSDETASLGGVFAAMGAGVAAE